MDQRRHPRFPVGFHSSFSSVNRVTGDGIIVDLSLRGCGILSPIDILPGTTLELRIATPSHEDPLTVGQAVVRWCRAGRVGLEFLSLQPGEWARLQDIVKDFDRQPYQRTDEHRQGADA